MTPDKFKLTKTEQDSALWKKIKAHYEERLTNLRRKNDNDSSIEITSKIRGRIAECRCLLALSESAKKEAD